jgi:hypothetical protein
MKEIVRKFKNGGFKKNGKWFSNAYNRGRAIKQTEYGEYYFYCDSVNQEKLEEFCEEHQLGWEIGVVKSKRINAYGTKERVVVIMWRRA